MKISVIIPTHNEGKYLPKLLESLNNQNFSSFEVIVSDWNSSDNTIKIAQEYGAKILRVEEKGIGPGRNAGAKIAKGKLLIFMDADVQLIDRFTLEKIWEKFQNGVRAGTTRSIFYDVFSGKILREATSYIVMAYLMVEGTLPGWFTFIDHSLFDQLGGYRNVPMEDVEFSKRVRKSTRVSYLRDPVIYVSGRRHKKEGFVKTYIYYLKLHLATFGPKWLRKRFAYKPVR